jgi:hypothetical protein
MRNRLPKEYAVTEPAAGLRPAGASVGLESGQQSALKDRLLGAAANSVGTHPMASLGAAFVVGILLGKWVKR